MFLECNTSVASHESNDTSFDHIEPAILEMRKWGMRLRTCDGTPTRCRVLQSDRFMITSTSFDVVGPAVPEMQGTVYALAHISVITKSHYKVVTKSSRLKYLESSPLIGGLWVPSRMVIMSLNIGSVSRPKIKTKDPKSYAVSKFRIQDLRQDPTQINISGSK